MKNLILPPLHVLHVPEDLALLSDPVLLSALWHLAQEGEKYESKKDLICR